MTDPEQDHLILSIDEKRGVLVFTIALEEPVPSASGKTDVIASTRGAVTFPNVTYHGRPVTVGFNAYLKK